VISGGCASNESGLIRVVQCRRKFSRTYREVKAHVDYLRSVLHRVVNRSQNIGEVPRAVGVKGLEWEQARLRGDKMVDAHHHGAVTERRIFNVLIENRRR